MNKFIKYWTSIKYSFLKCKHGKIIHFLYINKAKCNLNDPDYGHWGCCCECKYQLKVTEHYPQKDLGFYVCTVFSDIDKQNNQAVVTGKHGICECFQNRISKGE